MNWNTPVARKLYLRIWLAVAGSVAVLSLLVGWAWHVAERERERERERQPVPARQVVVRNAAGESRQWDDHILLRWVGPAPKPKP